MATATQLVLRPARELLQTLAEMAGLAGLPLETFATQSLESLAAEHRCRTIRPVDLLPMRVADKDDFDSLDEIKSHTTQRKRLTEGEIDRLIVLHRAGRTVEQLAASFSISGPTVYRWIWKRGEQSHNYSLQKRRARPKKKG